MCTKLLSALLILFYGVSCIHIPSSQCKAGQFFEPATLSCSLCPGNSSMITSKDGLSCVCDDHSIPLSPSRCKPCSGTEVVTSDGLSCVPRKCQTSGARVACRKCPAGYISITQQLDGSPMKEVQCIKCAPGFKPDGNSCVRCEACSCGKQNIVVSGTCVSKRFMGERPKYEGTIGQAIMSDVVKNEYLCVQNNILACRRLANECVKFFYPADLGGPCRLWLQPKLVPHKNLPPLNIESSNENKNPGEIGLPRGDIYITLYSVILSEDGSTKIPQDDINKSNCGFNINIKLGTGQSFDCLLKISNPIINATVSPFYVIKNEWKPLPVTLKKPSGSNIMRGTWSSTKFRRYFLITRYRTSMNTTEIAYLRNLFVKCRLQRQSDKTGAIKVKLSMEAQYSSASELPNTITTTWRIEQELPGADLLKILEVWSSVLGTLLAVYAIVQWRGVLRRGGLQIAILPLLSAAISDALYFGAFLSTLHSLAAEAGALGLALPLSKSEEKMIKIFIYTSVGLKAVKVMWTNWNQCRSEVFFLDWADYNPPYKSDAIEKPSTWRQSSLARYWTAAQSNRRTCPWYTTSLALFILTLLEPWKSSLPSSGCYAWAVGTIAWWSSYAVVITIHLLMERLHVSSTEELPRICKELGLSLLVFQEENYAHYVHGRDDDSPELKVMTGPLRTCRVVCAPQLRSIHRQLTTKVSGMPAENESRKVLLTKFLCAFFERALDGLSWVARERSILERLLDVEISVRESGNTSVLLYDADNYKPSCFNVTWWSEEWSLATFDAMMFGTILMYTDDKLIAALATLLTWQIMKTMRSVFGVQKNGKNMLFKRFSFGRL